MHRRYESSGRRFPLQGAKRNRLGCSTTQCDLLRMPYCCWRGRDERKVR
jgi:hypothetical protein